MKEIIISMIISSLFFVFTCAKKSNNRDDPPKKETVSTPDPDASVEPQPSDPDKLSGALGDDSFSITGSLALTVNQAEFTKVQLVGSIPPPAIMSADMSIINNNSLTIDGLALKSANVAFQAQ